MPSRLEWERKKRSIRKITKIGNYSAGKRRNLNAKIEYIVRTIIYGNDVAKEMKENEKIILVGCSGYGNVLR